jgi:hypothetical protein
MLISKFNIKDIETKIAFFEKSNNIKLPDQYKTFLCKYNGGYTPKTKFKVGKISSDIRVFYGIYCSEYGFDEVDIPEWVEKELLPIATDYNGNYIVIGLGNNNNGKIYFSDHELGYKIYQIGENLKDFLKFCKSEKIGNEFIQPINEREEMLIARGNGHLITDALRKAWQAEIDKFSKIFQEEVILE